MDLLFSAAVRILRRHYVTSFATTTLGVLPGQSIKSLFHFDHHSDLDADPHSDFDGDRELYAHGNADADLDRHRDLYANPNVHPDFDRHGHRIFLDVFPDE